jgi:hypothetical protein
MGSEKGQSAVKINVPRWMWGKKPRRMLDEAALRSRAVDGEPGAWMVCTNESYLGTDPNLIRLIHVAGRRGVKPQYELLRDSSLDIPINPPKWVYERLEKLRDRVEVKGELSDTLAHAHAVLMLAPVSELDTATKIIHEALAHIPLENSSSLPFEDSAVYFVKRNPALLHRVKIASVWLRLLHDEGLQGDTLPANFLKAAEEVRFESSFELQSGIHLLDAYFTPLAGALSPYIWLLVAARSSGLIGLSLGSTAVSGFSQFSSDPIQVLSPESGAGAGAVGKPRPELLPSSATAAFGWWTDALDRLFGVTSDLTVFADSDGCYDPEAHTHAILTMEQLFRRVHSMQYAHRDSHARRVLLFTLLDTLERLTDHNLEWHCSYRNAFRVLERLRLSIPEDAARILLPRAEDGVNALKSARDGFFMAKDKVPPGIRVPQPDGSTRTLDADHAVADYIKVLRNATHGHGAKSDGAIAKTNALLAQHNGKISDDIGWLGYLYLLDILNDPEQLRRKLRPPKTRSQRRK